MSPRKTQPAPAVVAGVSDQPSAGPPPSEVEAETIAGDDPELAAVIVAPYLGSAVSPVPKPLKKPKNADSFIEYNEKMRPVAVALYRRLQSEGRVRIEPGIPDVVTWLRGRGVKIKANMAADGTFYTLVEPPKGAPAP